MSESLLINWIRGQGQSNSSILIGPGDDTAALHWPPGAIPLLTTDMLLEGSSFLLDEAGPRAVGRKAMAVNLSDIAAMAGRPVAALVSVGLPKGSGQKLAQELFTGMKEIADEFETAIVGGDTNSWDGPLVINVALIGEATGVGPVARSGAEPGDWLLVTGPLGGSIAGKHLSFQPRVHEAQRLHALVELKAMIDLSDGLSTDLGHICDESKCGAILYESSIPISTAAKELNDEVSPLTHALNDGEDFELLFAVDETTGKMLVDSQPIIEWGAVLSLVGHITSKDLLIRDNSGNFSSLPRGGYQHEF